MKTATWHGSAQEFWRLRQAISKNCSCPRPNCSCPRPTTGRVPGRCAAHQMQSDQCILDHLLYAYRAGDEFRRQEFRQES